jgi:DNA-binding Xre family transcriptional regulator
MRSLRDETFLKIYILNTLKKKVNKYINKILNINRFNLVASKWETEVTALGGINNSNIKKIRMTKSKGVGFSRFIETI